GSTAVSAPVSAAVSDEPPCDSIAGSEARSWLAPSAWLPPIWPLGTLEAAVSLLAPAPAEPLAGGVAAAVLSLGAGVVLLPAELALFWVWPLGAPVAAVSGVRSASV